MLPVRRGVWRFEGGGRRSLIDGGGAGEIDGGGGGEDAAVGRWHGRRPCEAVRAFVMLAEAAVEDAFAVVGEADGDVFDAAARAGGGFS